MKTRISARIREDAHGVNGVRGVIVVEKKCIQSEEDLEEAQIPAQGYPQTTPFAYSTVQDVIHSSSAVAQLTFAFELAI